MDIIRKVYRQFCGYCSLGASNPHFLSNFSYANKFLCPFGTAVFSSLLEICKISGSMRKPLDWFAVM